MRKLFVYFLLTAALFGMAACSNDEDYLLDDNEIYLDDNIGEAWTGEGLPAWLDNRLFTFKAKSPWMVESYWFGTLWKVYKFQHKSILMLALKYEKVGNEYNWEESTICYDAYGRAVNFSKVEGSFKKGAELIDTNEICTEESVPQLSASGVAEENVQSLEWFQKAIDASCREVREAGNFMLMFSFGCTPCVSDEENILWGIQYEYADRAEKKRTRVHKLYTTTGEEVPLEEALNTYDITPSGNTYHISFSKYYYDIYISQYYDNKPSIHAPKQERNK